jgi:hypothetical protein
MASGRENIETVGTPALFHDGVDDSNLSESTQGDALQCDSRPGRAPIRINLDQLDLHADLSQLNRSTHARDSAANNQCSI